MREILEDNTAGRFNIFGPAPALPPLAAVAVAAPVPAPVQLPIAAAPAVAPGQIAANALAIPALPAPAPIINNASVAGQIGAPAMFPPPPAPVAAQPAAGGGAPFADLSGAVAAAFANLDARVTGMEIFLHPQGYTRGQFGNGGNGN